MTPNRWPDYPTTVGSSPGDVSRRTAESSAGSRAQIVAVEDTDLGWIATCAECGDVALKQERDDAHLAAARHLARVHIREGSRAWREGEDL